MAMESTSDPSLIKGFVSLATQRRQWTLEHILIKDYLQMQKYIESSLLPDDAHLQEFYEQISFRAEQLLCDTLSDEDVSLEASQDSSSFRHIDSPAPDLSLQHARLTRPMAFTLPFAEPYRTVVSTHTANVIQTHYENQNVVHTVIEWLINVVWYLLVLFLQADHVCPGSRSMSSWIWGTRHPIREDSSVAGASAHLGFRYSSQDIKRGRVFIPFDGGSGDAKVIFDRLGESRTTEVLPFRIDYYASRIRAVSCSRSIRMSSNLQFVVGIPCNDVSLGIRILGEARSHPLGRPNIALAVVGTLDFIHTTADGVLGLNPLDLTGRYASGTWMAEAFGERDERYPCFWFQLGEISARNKLYFGEYDSTLENNTRGFVAIPLWQEPPGFSFWSGRLIGYRVVSKERERSSDRSAPFVRFSVDGSGPLDRGQAIPNPGSVRGIFDTGSQLSYIGPSHMTSIVEMLRREGMPIWGGLPEPDSTDSETLVPHDPVSVDSEQAASSKLIIQFQFATEESTDVTLTVPLKYLLFGSEFHPVAGKTARLLSLQPFGVSTGFETPTPAVSKETWGSIALFGMVLMTKYTMFFNGVDNYVAFGYL
ncbi:hypothetical protein FISHEDRAFT_62362 [Fistulina hepatica ATCC 64428]|nr:hypothetical protein FISHEDRAFT_62362 [Fistulina hepatica ATCC 64428]